ncbi:MAG: hypothetical protein JWN04_4495 [Myxococcaceae bacterium]|nr:hypothetical protein [Myxococcaceae bacterium]
MSQSIPTTTIPVRVTFDLQVRQWIAATLEPLTLSVRARTYPQARRRLRRLVEREVGTAADVKETLELPQPYARQLHAYQRRLRLWRMLSTYLRQTRIPLAYSLLDLQMNQSDVASLMGISPAQLGTLLERESTSERPTGDELAAE